MKNEGLDAMTKKQNQYSDEPACYEITVWGTIAPDWSEWFGGIQINHKSENGKKMSVLSGIIKDQSALHGLLKKINDLNLVIVSIIRR
jgi:hypothetical protein